VRAASHPRRDVAHDRLLVVDPGKDLSPENAIGDGRVVDLPSLLRPGDLLVVNDAATLPASLQGFTAFGDPVEVRLAGTEQNAWRAVLFGRGDWRVRTEERPAPPRVRKGDRLSFGPGLAARVTGVSRLSPRLVELVFEGPAFWAQIYAVGKPVQYAHLESDLSLGDVQVPYAGRPWAFEPPSAGRPLTFAIREALEARGIHILPLTHAAGLSSTGDPALDAALPLPERFEIPDRTARGIEGARRRGSRVVAAGTTVVRALEGACALARGRLRGMAGVTTLRLGEGSRRRVVDGLLTGIHEPGTSHFELLTAFARRAILLDAFAHAEARGYLGHEFGDSMLILDGAAATLPARLRDPQIPACERAYDSGFPPHVGGVTGSRLTTRSMSSAPTRQRRSAGKTAA
jgi:S-adenosylmethionine:tRNA ribosyltransferase-isomerase